MEGKMVITTKSQKFHKSRNATAWQELEFLPGGILLLAGKARLPLISEFFSGSRIHHHSDLRQWLQTEQQQALLQVTRGCKSSCLFATKSA